MKQRILPLFFVMISLITTLQAQKNKKQQPATTGYAITAVEKGGRSWKEVRLVNVATGQEERSVYQSGQEREVLNARTGKPVVKTELPSKTTTISERKIAVPGERKVVNLDAELAEKKISGSNNVRIIPNEELHFKSTDANHQRVYIVRTAHERVQKDKPFATNSAAMAYDKKHERLYYTPMGINQLRYIDLKTSKIFFFEDEAFGVVKSTGDVPAQITRMTMASDGNGYALSNDGEHLIRFTTGKKPVITDLGSLTDDAANGKYSVHSKNMYGGDMIADASENLYLITANRHVFKISIQNRSAKYLGAIKGLPQGFSTNGAMVEDGSKVIIASSENTSGYYRFDLNTLQAEKISAAGDVFNASDLANGKLAFEKQKKDKRDNPSVVTAPPPAPTESRTISEEDAIASKGIAVFPNPVTSGVVKLSFTDQPAGTYQVQLMDLSGRLISSREVNINSSRQVEEFRLPALAAGGSYLLKVTGETNKVNVTNKILVQ